ncbi:hypothetical protein [Rhizomonospora bruguierae]|uniref:hypothetical protein n=1 Tax=Rhizomonospora bruguierae TaxID=1581705 RepID=UPI001BD137E9|nr:hypothetical protein [Micromonospora sp. NBRC 107566]
MTALAVNAVMGPISGIYCGNIDATEPLDTQINSTPAASAWTDLGGTLGGLTVNINQQFAMLAMDQVVDVVGRRLTERDIQVVTQLAEPTLDNLSVVLNGGTVTTGSGFKAWDPEFTSSATQPNYKKLMFDGWAPGANQVRRRFIIRRALSIAAVGVPFSKDGQTVFPVTFGCHYVDANTKPFRVVDEVVAP